MKVNQVVDHLFRHESGHIISKLSARYGMLHLSEIEDAVSDALVRAMKTWSIQDVPDSPAAWLYSVSSRIVIDSLRRKKVYYDRVIPEYKLDKQYSDPDEDEYSTLKLMLWCAHPEVTPSDQLALILQLVSGFSVKEISSALLIKSEAIKKRLQRARSKLRSVEDGLVLPNIEDVEERFPILRSAIYLGFNEGYYSSSHESVIREDLIFEALRLGKMLCDVPHSDIGISRALMGLMLYHTSRVPARRSDSNALVLLENQDRKLWDQRMVRLASDYLEKGMESDYYTPYHIEAVIAGIHTHTTDYQNTDWKTIAQLYGKLSAVASNPIIDLNYGLALLKSGQKEEARSILQATDVASFGVHEYLYYAVMAHVSKDFGQFDQQKKLLWKAIDSAPNESVRKVLLDRLMSVE